MDKQEKNRKVLVVGITVLAIFGFTGIFIPVAEGQGYAVPLVETVHSTPWFLHGNVKGASSSPTTYPGYIPIQIWNAYQYTSNGAYNTSYGNGETIAIVDAYGSPTIASDVNTFDSQFGLPAINLQIVKPFGKVAKNSGWALETSLDVEWAHAMAPAAKIVLIETPSASNTYLINDAINYAYNTTHANVISMSWGEAESQVSSSSLAQYASIFSYVANHGVILVAASGDSGANDGTSSPTVNYPASDPSVVGAGGTTLYISGASSTGGSYGTEYAWNSSGGGISSYFAEPSYQTAAGISLSGRGVPDVSYDANPNTGVWVYDSTVDQGLKGWIQVGGTSAASPQWAAIFADAQAIDGSSSINGANVHSLLYGIYDSSNYQNDFHDITLGYNGAYYAGPGYDEVTGIGSPIVYNLITNL
ncbi:MAG: S53 family peptidase [Candidatus Thermoplasmatota archaeon]|nr:S53 family peptidase [Candidatus Thermoplasmatota archaeon]MCL5988421.1 S53 family peptidase [Candidatus Thermoplasmatota archaeon]